MADNEDLADILRIYWRLKDKTMLKLLLWLVLLLSTDVVRAQVIDTLIEVGAHKLHFKIINLNSVLSTSI